MTGRRVIRPITMDGRLRLDGVRSQFGSEGRSGSSMCTNQLINRYLICADPSCILSINTSPHQSFATHSLITFYLTYRQLLVLTLRRLLSTVIDSINNGSSLQCCTQQSSRQDPREPTGATRRPREECAICAFSSARQFHGVREYSGRVPSARPRARNREVNWRQ